MITKNYNVAKEDYGNAGKVSSQIKSILKQLEIPSDLMRRIAVACYEAEINMVIHSDGGNIDLKIEEDKLELVFDDKGPGIDDLEKAFIPGYSTANQKAREMGFGAGMGLINIKRVSDDMDIRTSPKGTRLVISFKL